MAPKKPNPKEDPPAVSSDEDEEDSSSSDEETSDEQEPEKSPSPPPPPPKTLKTLADSPSSDESESDEAELDANQKSTATKPLDETSKVAKFRSKRPIESEAEGGEDLKRAKKEKLVPDAEEQKKPKQLFQRVWSEDDEITVLQGIVNYWNEKGIDPNQDMQAFHEYVKNSFHLDFNKSQLADKIRRLKNKFKNNQGKGLRKGDENRTFTKAHDQKAYDLSKKIWGSESIGRIFESSAKLDAKVFQNQKGNRSKLFYDKWDVVLFDKSYGVAGLEEFVLKVGLDYIEEPRKAELLKKWKNMQAAQLELYAQRLQLLKEHATLLSEVMKN